MNRNNYAMNFVVFLQIVAIVFVFIFMYYPTQENFNIFLAVTPLIATYIVDSVYFVLPDNFKKKDKVKEEKFIKKINLCISLMVLVLFLNMQSSDILIKISYIIYGILCICVALIIKGAYVKFKESKESEETIKTTRLEETIKTTCLEETTEIKETIDTHTS